MQYNYEAPISLNAKVTVNVPDELENRLSIIEKKLLELDQTQDLLEDSLRTYVDNNVATLTNNDITLNLELDELKTNIQNQPQPTSSLQDQYTFILKNDASGYADSSWEEIIEQGQAIQAKVWKEKEDYWSQLYTPPAGVKGWFGSATMPVITILCTEGEYFFKNTARLPGRFCVKAVSRWGSMLRFWSDGDKVLKDTIAYGFATNAPIGLYVEPSTKVGDMIVRNFEQQIEGIIISAVNGTLPVYLAHDPDRFWIQDVNILQHTGALCGIKHGMIVNPTNYPFPAQQLLEGHVALKDSRFINLQMEGPHTDKPHQAAMFLAGNNLMIQNLNMYGWMQGPYMHGIKNRVINGLTIHSGLTHDGRQPFPESKIVSYTISKTPTSHDSVSCIAGGFKQWNVPKQSVVTETAGYHLAGEVIF